MCTIRYGLNVMYNKMWLFTWNNFPNKICSACNGNFSHVYPLVLNSSNFSCFYFFTPLSVETCYIDVQIWKRGAPFSCTGQVVILSGFYVNLVSLNMFAALSRSLLLRVQFFLVHSMEEIILKNLMVTVGICMHGSRSASRSASKEQVNVWNHCKRRRRTQLNCKVIPLWIHVKIWIHPFALLDSVHASSSYLQPILT